MRVLAVGFVLFAMFVVYGLWFVVWKKRCCVQLTVIDNDVEEATLTK